jgi:hypothetical protein
MSSLKASSVHIPDLKDMSQVEKAGEGSVVETSGEVFDHSEYRALGWYVLLTAIALVHCLAEAALTSF